MLSLGNSRWKNSIRKQCFTKCGECLCWSSLIRSSSWSKLLRPSSPTHFLYLLLCSNMSQNCSWMRHSYLDVIMKSLGTFQTLLQNTLSKVGVSEKENQALSKDRLHHIAAGVYTTYLSQKSWLRRSRLDFS